MNVWDVLYKCQPCFDHDPLPRGFLTDRGPARSESSGLTLRQGKHRPVRQTFLAARWQTPTGRIVQRGPAVRPVRRAAVPPPAKADSRPNPPNHPSPQRTQGNRRWHHTTRRGSLVRIPRRLRAANYSTSAAGAAANSASSTCVATATRLSASSIRERSPASSRG